MFSHSQRYSWGECPLDHRIVCGVQEQRQLTRGRTILEDVAYGSGVRVCEAHGGKHDRERLASGVGLCRDLRCQLQVGQPGYGKDRQLLPADQCGQCIDRRDASDDRLGRVRAALD